jgi:hypothetical protein
MPSYAWVCLTCFCLVGCAGNRWQYLRQSVGPGPGPGCASTLDCACKNGVEAACAQLETPPKLPDPGPVLPPGAVDLLTPDVTVTPDKDTTDYCTEAYNKCVAAGGGSLPGRLSGYSRCVSCMEYCTQNGFWPQALYTWNGVRLPCPGL